MKQSDVRWILLVLICVMGFSTVLLVLRCSSDINDSDILTPPFNLQVPKRFTDRLDTGGDEAWKMSLRTGNITDSQRTVENAALDMIKQIRIFDIEERIRPNITRAYQNVTYTNRVNKHVTLLNVVKRAAKSFIEPVFYNNEFEVVPFTRFAVDRLYPVDPGLGRRVHEKPIGYRKREIRSVIEHAVGSLSRRTGQKFSTSDFIEGIYRVVPSVGTQYELYFRDRKQYHKVVVALPNLLPFVISDKTIPVHKDTVHVIVALSERIDTFQQFLQRFQQLAAHDNNVDLTVVYFGHGDLEKMQSLVREFNSGEKKDIVHLLTTSGKFSRGRGLQIGTDSLQNNSLLFLCDVDIVFTGSFLERCRLHASLGHSVYYPIVFSLYNPAILAQLRHTTTSPEKPVIARDAGFWRDFGYGMTCQYRADFLSVGGFRIRDEIVSNQPISGWGLEDVRLYCKHLRSGNVTVIRSTDPGIFHIWHEKTCPRNLTEDQYEGCLRSRALSEASHNHLGMLLLRHKVPSVL